LIGCSLGGSIAYSYLALFPDHSVSELIAMGAPLRWTQVHPIIRTAFISPALISFVRFSRTRQLLRTVFPVLKHLPRVLSMYMNVSTIDTRHIYEMTRTVEDPNPRVNRDIAFWIRNRDMRLDGVNITKALRHVELPLLLVVPNKDGIVPEGSAMSAQDAWGGAVDVLKVGDDDNWFAHANLFVANDARELVFDPMIRWLRQRN
jgi:pimeloyl-ACP methyl ester carboxylesterase